MNRSDNEEYKLNLRCDLDNILGLEHITVSESLIQATLKKANEQKKNQADNNIPAIDHDITTNEQNDIESFHKERKKINKGKLFKYSTFVACAACSVLILISISNVKMKKESDKATTSDMVDYEPNQEADLEESSNSIKMDSYSSDITNTTDTNKAVEEPVVNMSILDIIMDNTTISIKSEDIDRVIIKDEPNELDQTFSSQDSITKLCNELTNVQGDVQDYDTLQEGQSQYNYGRRYEIIAKDGCEFSKIYIWIPTKEDCSKEQVTSTCQLERQIVLISGKCINQIIDHVDTNKLDKIIK